MGFRTVGQKGFIQLQLIRMYHTSLMVPYLWPGIAEINVGPLYPTVRIDGLGYVLNMMRHQCHTMNQRTQLIVCFFQIPACHVQDIRALVDVDIVDPWMKGCKLGQKNPFAAAGL